MAFLDWFNTHLHVERFPMPSEVDRLKGRWHVINVSDMFVHGHGAYARSSREEIYTHYLPLSECTGSMGLNSLYGALQVLWEAEHADAHVLLHCAAGANRSPTVAMAYYYLRTGTHFEYPEPTATQQDLTRHTATQHASRQLRGGLTTPAHHHGNVSYPPGPRIC